MWRNSLSLSSSLLQNPNSYVSSSLSKSAINGVVSSQLLSHYSSSPPSIPSATATSHSDSLKVGLGIGLLNHKSDGVRGFVSSSGAIGELSSLASAYVDLARHYGRCYWELSKARLSLLVVATSGTGYVLGSGNAVDLSGLCWTCAGTMMVAASANTLNQVFEINNDARMKRTRQRPLPSGRITIPHAVAWATSAGLVGTAILASKANMFAAGFGASTLVLYAFVYTPLKQIHPVNTWVGAIVGAIPPLLGWAAASGQVSLNAMILPAALYFWQIPHFMALAYLCRNDYAAGGFRMFSLADASGHRTALVALRNCLYLVPLGFLAYDWGLASGWFCLESSAITLAISAAAFSFYRNRTTKKARRMFHASLLYLPVFMSGLLFHRVSDNQQYLREDSSDTVFQLSFSEPSVIDDDENASWKKNARDSSVSSSFHRPLVAYASIAPFPFLPVPYYSAP
ncbi:protoheme IX farnesyltransferase mitochondrial [Tripterygium wilfordii]|uniref:Heme O synthase n=1 Tax=Tripterygium wilfordii TaxID=458696 RepID=A0A7J7CG33_TRIWF|nr:protoheme IX farnesyltransferase, mitochondrial-like [Tripterygium wilfordii]KAF5732816.1 protoheme IX farnesyltransferase mitochondrial [Tripterygium wilfordii]